MLPFKCIYLPSKQALFSQAAWTRAQSIIGLCKPKKWALHFTVEFTSSFFTDQTLQNLLLGNLKWPVFMRHLLRSSIPIVTPSLQEDICNSFLEEYLIRYIRVNRIIRMDLWTKSYSPCLLGCVDIKI